MKNTSNITTFDQILDKKYGPKGTPKGQEWEQQFEAFRLAETDLTSLETFKEQHYGKIGTVERDKLENGYEAFKLDFETDQVIVDPKVAKLQLI